MSRKPIQTFPQRRYTAGQQAYEKMLNIPLFLRNANQLTEYPLTIEWPSSHDGKV